MYPSTVKLLLMLVCGVCDSALTVKEVAQLTREVLDWQGKLFGYTFVTIYFT